MAKPTKPALQVKDPDLIRLQREVLMGRIGQAVEKAGLKYDFMEDDFRLLTEEEKDERSLLVKEAIQDLEDFDNIILQL